MYTCKQLTESNTKTTEPINSYRNVSTNGPETFSTEKSILARRGPQHQPNDSSPESNKTQSNNIESLSKNFENEPADSHQHQHHHQQRIPFPMDTLPRPLDMVYGARLDNRIHFPPNHRPNLPPGLIVPPGLQGSILNLNNPFIKRPIFGPNAFGQPIKIDDLRGLGPIRPIPQSPIQNQKTKAPDEIGSSVKPIIVRPLMTTTTSTTTELPSISVSTSQSSSEQQQPPGPWDILQVSGTCNRSNNQSKLIDNSFRIQF